MHHVELLLDDASDAAVRAEWEALEAADLPNQSRHRSASNRPHVTVTMTEGWPEEARRADALAPLAALPLAAHLGAPLVFGRGPFVLARLVVASSDLLALHGGLVERLGPLASDLLVPGRWTPHMTLARRLTAEQAARALEVLGRAEQPEGVGDRAVVLEAARHWDSQARLDEPLTGRRTAPGEGAAGRSVG
ncbi:2'-5' RNA ligase family protein [Phycicoccus flavus]|uniref:2'-5' RNA ligase family protein n=1 Tax=Phycicoccus flavus TaxID=2502783 RepID=UPI001F473BAE|nr:2'-5' RNA ligase family protein [Phycicoccus flavus]